MPYSIIRVDGQDNLVADQAEDILDIAAGPGIEITTDASIDTVTISATTVGEQGFTGSSGINGTPGPRGAPGFSGSSGSQGLRGYTGSQGDTGNQGIMGYTGSAPISYSVIRVFGQENLVPDQSLDILNLVAGPGISIMTNASVDTITISSTGGGGSGATGFTGSHGSLGYAGSVGLQGYAGSVGTSGYAGSQGPIGYTGSYALPISEIVNGSSNVVVYADSSVIMAISGTPNIMTVTGTETTLAGNLVPSTNVSYNLGSITNHWLNLWSSAINLGNASITESGNSISIENSTVISGVPVAMVITCTKEDGTVTVQSGIRKVRFPYNIELTELRASLSNAQVSGSTLTIQVKKNGTNLLTTPITIDNSETSSRSAAVQPVIDATAKKLNDDDEITVDVTQAGTGATGLKVTLNGRLRNIALDP